MRYLRAAIHALPPPLTRAAAAPLQTASGQGKEEQVKARAGKAKEAGGRSSDPAAAGTCPAFSCAVGCLLLKATQGPCRVTGVCALASHLAEMVHLLEAHHIRAMVQDLPATNRSREGCYIWRQIGDAKSSW